MPHTHVIDNKVVTMEDATCPICHPELAQQQATEGQEILPRAYRTAQTVVLKVNRVTMVTTNFYQEKKVFLQTLQSMMRDQTGKVILGQDQKPMWNKKTIRIPPKVLKEWLMELSTLVNEVESTTTVPARD
jgi:hypothetical protein